MAKLRVPVTDRDHAQGAAEAPLTLVEYGDYECPHCGRAYPIVKEIQRMFGERLRFVFRNFPLTQSHAHAQQAAEAAEVAGEMAQFWPMHDLLFEKHGVLGESSLLECAAGLGLDRAMFKRKLEGHEGEARVKEDFIGGVKSGVNGTPSFFINGVRYDDSWDLETLAGALERWMK
jgi:protein-disulfide isomerase